MPQALNGLETLRNRVQGFPSTPSTINDPMTAMMMCVRMVMARKKTGMMNMADSNLDARVRVSDAGSDFQNRMLRSLRSSYNEPSR